MTQPLDPHAPYLAQLAWHDAMRAIRIALALASRPPLPAGKGLPR